MRPATPLVAAVPEERSPGATAAGTAMTEAQVVLLVVVVSQVALVEPPITQAKERLALAVAMPGTHTVVVALLVRTAAARAERPGARALPGSS